MQRHACAETAQKITLRFAFIAALAACAIGLFLNRPWQQEIWSPMGFHRLLVSASLFGLVWLIGAWRRIPVALISMLAMVVATLAIAGPVAFLAVSYFVLSSWALGRLLLHRGSKVHSLELELVTALSGVALWQTLVGFAAHMPVNNGILWTIILASPIAVQPHLLGVARNSIRDAFRSGMSIPPYSSIGLTAFVLFAHLAAAMRPEASADGLAMHLIIPATVSQQGRWWYDVERYSWAVMPMAGDWAYTAVFLLGGEPAAKLLNFGLLAAIVALIGSVATRWIPVRSAALITGIFAATPLVHLVTGSLYIENFQAVMLLGAAVSLAVLREQGDAHVVILAAVLMGGAMSAKLGSAAYVGPLLIAAALASRKLRLRSRLAAMIVFLLVAMPPYLTAYVLTGNPVFPFMNSVFHSRYFDSDTSLRDLRFATPLSWRTPYDATFHTSDFLESQDGALGYQYLLLFPVCLASLVCNRGRPWLGSVSMGVSLAGAALTWAGASNVRYCYAALPMLSVGFAAALSGFQKRRSILYHSVLGVSVICVLTGTLMLSTSVWWKDFLLNPFNRQEVDKYLANQGPGRMMVEYLNRRHPGRSVLFLVNGQSAGLQGRIYLNSWHNQTFYSRLKAASSVTAVAALLDEEGIGLLIVPGQARMEDLSNPVLREFVECCTVSEYAVGGFAVASVRLPSAH